MSCQKVHTLISAHLDESLPGLVQDKVTQHLLECPECAAAAARHRQTRVMLRQIPAAPLPPALGSRLRVMASHERERRLTRLDLATRLEHAIDHLRLLTDNMMRPLALPFAGGLLSALFLFGMLVPTLAFRFDHRNDIPFYTEARLVQAPVAAISDEMPVVELTIDERGNVKDWSVPVGKLDRETENNLLAKLVLSALGGARYTPASLLGCPTTGKVTLSFQPSHSVTVTPEPEPIPQGKPAFAPYVITVRG